MQQTILSVFFFALIAQCLSYTYPIFGTKRYQRAQYQPPVPSYQYPQYQAPQYYDLLIPQSPYSDDTFYYTSRHPSYGMPTYHGEYKPRAYYGHGPSYGYEDSNPLDDLHEEMLQEDALDHGDGFPTTGQEIWYESPGRNTDSLAKANAAFLRNLMIYNSQYGRPNVPGGQDLETSGNINNYNEYDYEDTPMDWYEAPTSGKSTYDSYIKNPSSVPSSSSYHNVIAPVSIPSKHKSSNKNEENNSDEEVKELKSLVNKHRKEHDSLYSNQNWIKQDESAYSPMQYDEPEYEDASWINWDSKRSTEPKKTLLSKFEKKPLDNNKNNKPQKSVVTTPGTMTTITTKSSTPKPVFSTSSNPKPNAHMHDGQKEIVLPRPAVPIRHPFQQPPIFNELDTQSTEIHEDKKHAKPHSTGAIYDTIKQLLAMEEQLEMQKHIQQKRYVSDENSLVQELDGLKRHAA